MKSHSEQFQRRGFTSVAELFSPDEAGTMRANVKRYLQEVAPELPPAAAIRAMTAPDAEPCDYFVFMSRMDLYDPYFEELRNDPRLAELAGQLLGGPVEAQHVQFLDIVPGVSRPTPPHQDAPIFSIEPSHAVTLWIPLCDATVENGCMHYVSGSHWQGYMAHAESGPRRLANNEEFLDKGTAVPIKPGGLVAHHCFTIHYSSENRSGSSRWALAVHFYPKGTQRFDESEWEKRQGV